MATENTTAPADTGGADDSAELTLRDELDAAFDQHASDEPDEKATGERARDGYGRFARAAGEATGKQTPAEGTTGQQEPANPTGQGSPVAPALPELKAPASWTPTAREKWATVDPELRGEIHRREVEHQRTLQDTAGLRNFAQQFEQVVRPYEMFIRAEGSEPLQAMQTLFNAAAELRVGTPQQKVNIVAGIIQQHAVDLQQLDDVLASLYNGGGQQGPQRAQTKPAEFRDPRLDLLLAQQEQERTQHAQYEEQQLRQGLAQFAQAHEFYGDVAETMADIVDNLTRRGLPVDLEKVYARACQLDENVSTILQQRNTGQQRNGGNGGNSQAVLRAKRAAVSVKGDPNPEGSTVPRNDSVRAAIEAAFDAHS
jgi:hypothetical protein